MSLPPDRLKIKDEKLFPIQAFFNSIPDFRFIEIIQDLARGVGHGYEVTHCQFPSDLDPNEPRFEGVRFSIYEDQVVVGYPVFLYYLKLACEAYLKAHPQDRAKLDDILRTAQLDPRIG